jgi:hypothetical protein
MRRYDIRWDRQSGFGEGLLGGKERGVSLVWANSHGGDGAASVGSPASGAFEGTASASLSATATDDFSGTETATDAASGRSTETLEQQHLADDKSHVNTVVVLRAGDVTGHGDDWRSSGSGSASKDTPRLSKQTQTPSSLETFQPKVLVRMWPKPFVFRSFMKDVRRVEMGEAASLATAPGAPRGAGVCLGQVSQRKGDLIGGLGQGDFGRSKQGQGDKGETNPRGVADADTSAGVAVADASASPEQSKMDFSTPFIVSPCSAKNGSEKVEQWDKFQRFCFVIETKAFLGERLPEPETQGKPKPVE